MFQRIFTAYRKLARLASKRVGSKRSAFLHVTALEERATPAVDFIASVVPPQTVVVAPGVAEVANSKPIVRMDLVPLVSTAKHDADQEGDEWAIDKTDYDTDSLVTKDQDKDRLDFGTVSPDLEITDEDLEALADELEAAELAGV